MERNGSLDEITTEDSVYAEVEPGEFDLAKKKINSQKILYLFMLGLLVTASCITIIFKYQNETLYYDPDTGKISQW